MNSSMKCVMHVISSNARFFMIISKCKIWNDFVVLTENDFCIILCILKTTHVSQLTVLNASLLITFMPSILRNWSMTTDLQWLIRRCHIHEIAFDKVLSFDWTVFANSLIELYSINKTPNFSIMSQTCFFDCLWTKIFENMSQSYFC